MKNQLQYTLQQRHESEKYIIEMPPCKSIKI